MIRTVCDGGGWPVTLGYHHYRASRYSVDVGPRDVTVPVDVTVTADVNVRER